MARTALRTAAFSSTLIVLASTLVGCSDLSARVSGKVLMDGKPLKVTSDQRGMIVFRPVSGGATCTGLISESGTYEISTGSSLGLSPGDYMISVRVIKLIAASNKNEKPTGVPITPAVYSDPLTSGLVMAVKSGENVEDIKLSSDAGPAVLPEAEVTEGSPEGESEAGMTEEGSSAEGSPAEGSSAEGESEPTDESPEASSDDNAGAEEAREAASPETGEAGTDEGSAGDGDDQK